VSTLIPFIFSGREVRTITRDGEPWFVASDVTAILGYRMASDATRRLDEDERGTHSMRTPGGEQPVTVVSESGLYSLILGSKVEGARAFKRWVTHEVLPAIRKTGQYSAPLSRRELAENWADAERRAEVAEKRTAAIAPSAASWDRLAESVGDYSLRDAAQILDRDPAIKTGQNRLAAYLREIAWCGSDGRPYQRQVEAGRLVLRSRTYDHPVTGESTPTTQLRVTPKGLGELHRLMGGSAPLADTQLALVVSA